MKDFSTILLINILRETVDTVKRSPDIDQANPGTRELNRTLMEQIVRLQASEPKFGKFIVDQMAQARNGF